MNRKHFLVGATAVLVSSGLFAGGRDSFSATPAAQEATNQASTRSDQTKELYFRVLPVKQFFAAGEPVEVKLELYSRSEQPVWVSRLQRNDFVTFKLIGPDGSEVPWRARVPADAYTASEFTQLDQYKTVSATSTISLKDGEGFVFDKPGQYSLTAEFSMGASQKFTAISAQATPAVGTFQSSRLAFCIEACILEPLPVRANAPRASLDAVRQFYTYITKHRPLGTPSGEERRDLRPYLSSRLAKEIDSLCACDRDYYQRYGAILRANTDKPGTPWLEEGLFTGPDDAATPSTFRILASRMVGENRVDVLVAFDQDWGTSEGYVTAILENGHWVIDDYVAMYGNDELLRLSAGYAQCLNGKWIGEVPE